uniref:Uncharacterized protein n=1 Tax=Arundo donax TaxID=35708 RepID=A0A0A9HC27_ARUDO
MSLQKCKSH